MEGTRYRVVIADDVPQLRRIVRLTLELDGRFEVVGEAGDGDEALKLVHEHHPDVILLDLSMPVDGAGAIPHIRDVSPRTRIVVFTASSPGDVGGVDGLGVDALIQKGAPMDAIVRALLGTARVAA